MNNSSIIIEEISHFVPDNVITNEDLIKKYSLKMKSEWVEKRIGITERRWVSNEAASDLVVKACEKIDLTNFKGSLWVSTISGDYITPSTASIIKRKLNLKDHFPAIDINAACAGQLFALESAYLRLLNTSETEALVVATEVRSKWLNKKDRRTVFLFGDGACVIKLKKVSIKDKGLRWCHSQTIASEGNDIFIPAGGSQLPISSQELEEKLNFIKMNDGTGIFEKTTENLVNVVTECLSNKNETIDEYDFFIFHQGNGAIIKKICENLKIDLSKTHINFHKYGNTSSASLGIALSEAAAEKKIKKGDRVLLLAMGAGYHISCSSILWSID